MFPRVHRSRVLVLVVAFAAVSTCFLVKFGSSAQKKAAAPSAAVIVANPAPTVVDVAGTVDGDADPGDTLEWTYSIKNTGDANATGVSVSIPIAGPQTLDGTFGTGGVVVSPIAGPDSANVYGNVRISTATGAINLLANDVNPLNGTNTGLTTTAANISSVQCPGCLNVTVNADGTFTYDPPVGYTGSDSFTYTLNGPNSTTATGTATLTISGMLWFVDASAAACTTVVQQCGKSAKPYSSLDAFRLENNGTALHPSDTQDVFIAENASSYTLAAALTMRTGQRFVGQDTSPNGTPINTVLGITLPTGSVTLPVTNTAGNAVTVTAFGFSVGSNNTLKGLTVTNTGSSAKLSGSNIGTFTVADVTISGTGRAMSLGTGTLNGTFTSVASTSSSGTLDGMNLASLNGNVNFGSVTISGSTLQGLLITGCSFTSANFGATSVTSSPSTGISIANSTGALTFGATTVTTPTGTGIDISGSGATINFAATTVSKTAQSGTGVSLTTNSGPITFGNLAITTSNGTGLLGTNNTGTVTVTANQQSINATGGPAVNITSSTTSPVSLNLAGASSTNSGTTGVNLTNVTGTASLGTGAISGSTGVGFAVTGGTAAVTYAGTITQTTAARVVDIESRTGGSVGLSGAITSNNGTGQGIFLNANTGSAISFTGGMAISTGGNPAFTATGGGTVTATQDNSTIVNTLATTTATALNVANTTIGASNLTFRSITAGTAAGSAGDGIILNTTGASGSLTVTGTGSAGSGGTIQHKTGADSDNNNGVGIFLNSTSSPSLSWMQLNDFDNYAIRGIAVNNLTIDHMVVSGNNGNNGNIDEGSVIFGYTTAADATSALTGSVSVTNSTFGVSGNSIEDTFRVRNGNGTLNRITFTGDTFACLNTTGDALNFEEQNSAIVNVTVQNSFFTAAAGDLFQFNPNGTGATDLIFNGNTLTNNNPLIATGGGGVSILDNGTSNFTFHIANNTFRDSVGMALLLVKSTGPSSYSGTFTGNTIGVAAVANSGSKEGDGIKVQNAGQGTITVAITNNNIHQYNNFGIELETGGGATAQSGVLNATITGNTIDSPGTNPATAGIAKNGIHLNAGTVPADTYVVCADIGGAGALANSLSTSGAPNDSAAGGEDIRLRQRQDTTVRLRGYTGAPNGDATVISYIIARNGGNGAPSAIASNNVSTATDGWFDTSPAGSACTQPTTMPVLGDASDVAFEPVQPLGIRDAGIALAEPMVDMLGGTATAQVIAISRPVGTEDQPSLIAELYDKLTTSIEPTVYAQNAPGAVGVVVNGSGSGFTIPAGATVTIKYRTTVNNGPYASGVDNLASTATVTSNVATITPTASIILDAAPDLAVTTAASAPEAQPGSVLTYTINYHNITGPNAAANNGQSASGATITAVVPNIPNVTFNRTASGGNTIWTDCADNAAANTTCHATIPAANVTDGNSGTVNFAVNLPVGLPASAAQITLAAPTIAETAPTNGTDRNTGNNTAANTGVSNVRGIWLGSAGAGTTAWAAGTTAPWSNGLFPNAGQNISIPVNAGTTSPEITTGDIVVNNIVFATGSRNLTIDSGRKLTVNQSIVLDNNKVVAQDPLNATPGLLELISPATISVTAPAGRVEAAMSRTFVGGNLTDAPLAAFTYPVGTSSGSYPLTVTPTAGSTGSLTVQVFDGNKSPLVQANTMQRYWTLSSTGTMQADLLFDFAIAGGPTTLNGNTANYQPTRVSSGGQIARFPNNCATGACFDLANRRITIKGSSFFSGSYTAGDPAGTTAAYVNVSGRVVNANGAGIRGARVLLDDGTGHAATGIANAFGYYTVEVLAGSAYMLNASSRGYVFTPRVIVVNDTLTDVDMTALP